MLQLLLFTNFENMMLSSSKSKVCFFYEQRKISLKNRSSLKTFIEGIFRRERKKLIGLNYIFTSDKVVLKINQQFLHHDFFTDIISFDLGSSAGVNGEIYISIDRVRENARILHISFREELHRVIFHGALHLCGYKDKTSVDIETMRQKEGYYLDKYLNSPSH